MAYRKIFNLALKIGEVMLRNGSETHRVEAHMVAILKTSGCEVCEAFVTPTGIFVTLDDPKMDAMTYVKRVTERRIHLHKVALCVTLTDRYVRGAITLDVAIEDLKSIVLEQSHPKWLMVLAAGVVSGSFAILFGATLTDGLLAMALGLLVALLSHRLNRLGVSKFFVDLICSMVVAFLVILLVQELNLAKAMGPMIVGCLFPFVPGVAITNGIFDTIQGNLLSGLSRGAEALMIAASLAAGIGFVFKLYGLWFGGVLV